jgi:hypothetical protein
VPQEQADAIAEQIGKTFASDEPATKEFVQAESAALRTQLKELGLLSWKLAGMLLPPTGLVATLTKLLRPGRTEPIDLQWQAGTPQTWPSEPSTPPSSLTNVSVALPATLRAS